MTLRYGEFPHLCPSLWSAFRDGRSDLKNHRSLQACHEVSHLVHGEPVDGCPVYLMYHVTSVQETCPGRGRITDREFLT